VLEVRFEGGELGHLDLWRLAGELRVLHFLQLMHHRMPCGLRSYPSCSFNNAGT
jgi:hypothetical protein